MKINLRNLKLYQENSVYFHFSGKIDDSFLAASGAGLSQITEIELIITRRNAAFSGQGTLKTTIDFTCSRCLKLFSVPLDTELTFIVAEAENEAEYVEEVLLLENDEVDITHFIEGVIFTEVPLNPICDLNCRGLCPVCGGDKNIDVCNCHIENIDPRWEKLKKFK